MPLKGDIGRIARLRLATKRLISDKAKLELAQRIAATGVKLVSDEFRKSQNPYGKAWAPVDRADARTRRARARRAAAGKKVRGDKPLLNTGRLRASVHGRGTTADTVRVSLPVSYAVYHQAAERGKAKFPRRQIVPEGNLGPIWGKAIDREARKFFREQAQKLAKAAR